MMESRGWMKACLFVTTLACAGCMSQSSPEVEDAPRHPTPDSVDNAAYAVVDASHGQLFGAAAAGRWIPADSAEPNVAAGDVYRLYTLTRVLGQRKGTAPHPPDETCTNSTVRIEALPQAQRDIIALGGQWDALPRVPVLQDSSLPVYQDAAASILRARGIADPVVNVTQIIRVDLEGDGIDEVLLSGNLHRGSVTSARAGDYSFVILRKVTADTVKTMVIEEEYFLDGCLGDCAPMTYHVSTVLDANGDGVMEIVIAIQYFEGLGKAVYAIEGDEVREVLSWNCGV